MKGLLAASSVALAGLLAVFPRPVAPVQAAQGDPQALEARVAALEAELQLVKKRHDETRALLEETLVYLDKQAASAQALLAVLDESEKEGFAVGENWRSRELLLAGLRADLREEQGVPKPPAPPKAPPATPPGRPARQ